MTDKSRVERLVRPEIRALSAYHVPDATGLIKLDAMENPYTWPREMREAWAGLVCEVELNRYPDPGARAVKARLREVLAVPRGMDLVLGNGSDELIQMVCLALARPNAVVMAPTPTFVMYEMIATFAGMRFVGVPLGEDFALDETAMLEAVERERPAVVFLAYPNNPTGNLFDADAIERLLHVAPGLVVVDEAYHAFAHASFMERLPAFDNLLVMRTLSKQGLAGLRLGALAGAPVWLTEFDKVRLPYNLGSLTQTSALFALQQIELLDAQTADIRVERERLFQALSALAGIRAWPSHANFILFQTVRRKANEVFDALLKAGVLIKNLDRMIPGCLRVTVGTPEENTAFLNALKHAL